MRGASLPRVIAVWGLTASLVFGMGVCGTGCKRRPHDVQTVDAGTDAAVARLDEGAVDAGSATLPESATSDSAMPPAQSDELTARMRHLLEAIAQNSPDLAGDVVFPREAWMMVRDEADPQTSWDRRVKVPFGKAVEKLHKRTKNVEHARFVSFSVGHAVIQSQPKKKDLRKALWRVRHSKVVFTIDNKTQSFEIAEMTSWRGAWYVTKLR